MTVTHAGDWQNGDATQWKAFLTALDAPLRPLPRLKRLLKEPGFFDTAAER
jgi:hypothetical protein